MVGSCFSRGNADLALPRVVSGPREFLAARIGTGYIAVALGMQS